MENVAQWRFCPPLELGPTLDFFMNLATKQRAIRDESLHLINKILLCFFLCLAGKGTELARQEVLMAARRASAMKRRLHIGGGAVAADRSLCVTFKGDASVDSSPL